MARSAPRASPFERSAIALAFFFLLAIHVGVIVALIDKPPRLDESEQLQGSIMMARGERMYKDFAEHHSPFFSVVLWTFAPADGGENAVGLYLIRARAVSALFGTVAIAVAAWIVWKASGKAYAAIIFIALLLANSLLWARAFAEVRAEPPSLALWWMGTALVLLPDDQSRRNAMFRGLGIGLVAQACLWNPKWPVASLVIGVIFLLALKRSSRRNIVIAIATGLTVAAGGLLVIVPMIDLRAFLGSTFGLTATLVQWSRGHQMAQPTSMPVPWATCPSIFHLTNVIPAAAVIAFGIWSKRHCVRNARLVWSILAIAAASLIEIRFVYPYPALWLQYFVLWSMAGAAILALVPQVGLALLERLAPRSAMMKKPAVVTLTLLALLAATDAIPHSFHVPDPDTVSDRYLRARLGPRDTVWMDMTRFPIGSRQASYYWFGFRELVPAALKYAQTPAGRKLLPQLREEDLPPCRLERGLEPNLRFLNSRSHYDRLPIVLACFDRLEARGLAVRTPFEDVYSVVRPAAR
jgi:hypothetical protein